MTDVEKIAASLTKAGRDIRDGTYADRCDYCQHWFALSNGRVMGWCTALSPVPSIPPMLLLLNRQEDDHLTAYNQGCDAFYLKENYNG